MFKRRKNPKWSFHSPLATLYSGIMQTMGWWNNPWNEHGRSSWSLRLTRSSAPWGANYHKGCTQLSTLTFFQPRFFSGTELLCWRRGSVISGEVENHRGEVKKCPGERVQGRGSRWERVPGCSPNWTTLSKLCNIFLKLQSLIFKMETMT